MKKVLFAISALMLLPASDAQARHRTHVTIHKDVPAQQPSSAPIAAIPVIGIFYDIARRTDCRGDVLGVGGAGFDPEPKTGNFLIPAVYRSQCAAQPRRRP
jgi:hypothetical protein